MDNFASLTRISLLLILMCWTSGSTGAAFNFEEELLKIKENNIQMKEIVKKLESKVTQLETTIQEKVAELELKDVELERKDAKMNEKVIELEAKVKEQDSLLTSLLLREKHEHINTNSDSAVAINGLPSSCADLRMIGHIWSGFYSVKGSAMIESVYCDFTKLPSDAGYETWVGYADIKSAPVHFYVQQNQSVYNIAGAPMPFTLAILNEGNAMNLTTGFFTAPRTGTYFFSFTGLARFPVSSSYVWLKVALVRYKNFEMFASGSVQDYNTVTDQMSPVTFQSTLNLNNGDQLYVSLYNTSSGAYLYDDYGKQTQFVGFLLKEEILVTL